MKKSSAGACCCRFRCFDLFSENCLYFLLFFFLYFFLVYCRSLSPFATDRQADRHTDTNTDTLKHTRAHTHTFHAVKPLSASSDSQAELLASSRPAYWRMASSCKKGGCEFKKKKEKKKKKKKKKKKERHTHTLNWTEK